MRLLASALCGLMVGVLPISGLARAETLPLDLPLVLRLAGAEALDIQRAQQSLLEAQASERLAEHRLLPAVSLGSAVQRHEGKIQIIDGPVIDADKQSAQLGLALNARWEPAESWYQRLALRRRTEAAAAALDVHRQQTLLSAVQAYFELLRATAQAGIAVADDALADRQFRQIEVLQAGGLLAAGDLRRAETRRARTAAANGEAEAAVQVASARLAEILNLDPAVSLRAPMDDLVPLPPLAVPGAASAAALVEQALQARAEIDAAEAELAVARVQYDGARYAPLFPTLSAQLGVGALGGGPDQSALGRNFGRTTDFGLGLSWQLGPGGLLDAAPRQIAAARLHQAELQREQQRQRIRREVIEQQAMLQAAAASVTQLRSAVQAAERASELSQMRLQQGVGAALEDLLAAEDLSRARSEYAAAVTRHNQAWFGLQYALGMPPERVAR